MFVSSDVFYAAAPRKEAHLTIAGRAVRVGMILDRAPTRPEEILQACAAAVNAEALRIADPRICRGKRAGLSRTDDMCARVPRCRAASWTR